jgi:hypothetical protein
MFGKVYLSGKIGKLVGIVFRSMVFNGFIVEAVLSVGANNSWIRCKKLYVFEVLG